MREPRKEGRNARRKEFFWQRYKCNATTLYYNSLVPKFDLRIKEKKNILFHEGGESRITISINEARQSCKNPAIFRFQQVHRSVDDRSPSSDFPQTRIIAIIVKIRGIHVSCALLERVVKDFRGVHGPFPVWERRGGRVIDPLHPASFISQVRGYVEWQ